MNTNTTNYDWHDDFANILDYAYTDKWPEWSSIGIVCKTKSNKTFTLEIYSDEEYTGDDYWCAWYYDLPSGISADDVVAWKYDEEY